MKLKPQKVVGKIPAGTYEGVIRQQYENHDGSSIWLKLEVEGIEDLLLVSLPLNSVALNNFAADLADENGEVDTEDWIDTMIRFAVVDRIVGGETYSRIQKMEAIMEEEANV